MARVCQITGKRARVGNNVSHAKNRTKRRFEINLQEKKFFIPSEEAWVFLKVSAHGLRIIDKLGIEEALIRSKKKGLIKF